MGGFPVYRRVEVFMKNSNKLLLILLLCGGLAAMFPSCSKGDDKMLDLLVSTERDGYKGEALDRERIEELENSLRKYEKDIQKRVQDTGQLGIYYRILAIDLMEKKMYGPALEEFRKALDIYPANPVLLYYSGVCRAYLAASEGDSRKREEGVAEASYYYERAVELDGSYQSALYASAVLALFEMDDPVEGERRTLRLLERYPGHIGGKFLLARIRLMEGFPERAAELYGEISDSPRASDEEKQRAEQNRAAILGGSYE
jgi:tetratricopeptide (TPR) repeat protein